MCPVSALCAPRLIGGLGQAHQYAHDAGVLVRCRIKEQSVVHKTGDGCNRSVLLGRSWPNNGDRPEVCAKEQGGLGHDQVGLKQIGDSRTSGAAVGIDAAVEVRKREVAVGNVWRVACLVLPCLKVHDLRSPDAKQDSQNLEIADLLGERWVQAGTANFDERKVESRRAGNGLEVVGDAAVRVQREIPIVKRDSWVLSFGQVRDGVFKSSAEIGVSTGASVPSPPRRVHSQLL
jgi:hypothetical protein